MFLLNLLVVPQPLTRWNPRHQPIPSLQLTSQGDRLAGNPRLQSSRITNFDGNDVY